MTIITPPPMTTPTRFAHIDVARGILIVMLVMLHTFWVCHSWYHIDNKTLDLIRPHFNGVLYSFLMNAFFVITGYCTNWHRPFVDFARHNAKSLLVPAIVFTILVPLLLRQFNLREVTRTLVFYGGKYWFLIALLISKLLYYVIIRLSSSIAVRVIACVALAASGVLLNQFTEWPNYWWINHALVLTFSLGVGHVLRNCDRQIIYTCSAITFFIAVILAYSFKGGFPTITASFDVSIVQLPFHMIISSAGSVMIIGVSKLLPTKDVMSHMGKHSLVIYILHLNFLDVFVSSLRQSLIDQSSGLFLLAIFVMIVVTSTVLCVALSKLLNMKFLRYTLGKW